MALEATSKCLAGLIGGFSISAHVAFTILSIPKDIFHSTQTTKIVLVPTKCVLSNGTVAFPFIAVMAYATVVFTSLFWILRAKGFSSWTRHPGSIPNDSTKSDLSSVGEQPPSPPPESGSDCSADNSPRRRQWMWLLWLIAVLLTLSGEVGAYFYLTIYDSRNSLTALASFSRHGLSFIEQCFFDGRSAVASCISTVKIYISLYGRRHSKVILIALVTHSVLLLIVSALRRFHHYSKKFARKCTGNLCVFAVVIPTIACSSHLSWIFWKRYYLGYRAQCLLNVREINWILLRFSSYLSSLATSQFLEISTIIGIGLVHISMICLQIVLLVIYGFPSIVKDLVRTLGHAHGLRRFVLCCTAYIAALYVEGLIDFSLQLYPYLHPDTKQILWQVFTEWKSAEMEDFHELTAGLPNTLRAGFNSWCEIWSSLHLMHKLLIVAPAVIFYGYFYVIPAVCRIPLIRKSRRRCLPAPFLLRLIDSVENRLAQQRTIAIRRPEEAVKAAPQRTPRCREEDTSENDGGLRVKLPVRP
ncbi:hypothetical protein FB451DRAFT_1554973 [Mycena latifolia]|nr:hypothetical protein FB451DRAFT_1554973 [Mycena latifolia]